MVQRKRHTAEFKTKVAIEALKEQKTVNQISSHFEVHSGQVSQWKRLAKDILLEGFQGSAGRQKRGKEIISQEELYSQIGQLKVELDWIKKNQALSVKQKKGLVDLNHNSISITRQCHLLGLNRSSLYTKPIGETEENLSLMRMIDKVYTATPYFGSRKIAVVLSKKLERPINRKRVQRLMRVMGIEAIYPKPKLSVKHPEHKIYPYLLRDYKVVSPNDVWSTDITYIPLEGGFAYLIAVIDWYSRRVLSWSLSNTMDLGFCQDVLKSALQEGKPNTFNTDQGSQFTSLSFVKILEDHGIQVSMDGRGRALDNIFVERLWRSVKYEDIYIKGYTSMGEAHEGLGDYFGFYNEERPHQSLGYKTPNLVHNGGLFETFNSPKMGAILT